MEHNTTISLSFYPKYHRFFFSPPFIAAGAVVTISSAELQSGRARTQQSGFYECSILIVVVHGWHVNESQSPSKLQIWLSYKDNRATQAFSDHFNGLLALLQCHLIQTCCWHSCGKDCHGPPSPPYTALPGAAACPLNYSCMLNLCKYCAKLGCISLKSQSRGWRQNQRGKRLWCTHLNSTYTHLNSSACIPTNLILKGRPKMLR